MHKSKWSPSEKEVPRSLEDLETSLMWLFEDVLLEELYPVNQGLSPPFMPDTNYFSEGYLEQVKLRDETSGLSQASSQVLSYQQKLHPRGKENPLDAPADISRDDVIQHYVRYVLDKEGPAIIQEHLEAILEEKRHKSRQSLEGHHDGN